MYAIINTDTGKWLFGTDYNYCPPKQRTSFDEVMTFGSEEEVREEFERRHCGKNCRIAEIKVHVQRLLLTDPDKKIENWDDLIDAINELPKYEYE